MLISVGLVLSSFPLRADATRKVAIPPWACAVTKCTQKAVDEDVAREGPALNKKALLALRGAVTSQVLCPFGDESGSKGATQQETVDFFDGFAKAYDKIHGITHDENEDAKVEKKEETKKEEIQDVVEKKEAKKEETTKAVAGTVEKVDRDSFTKLFDAHDQDMLVVFYAPWCPHCKAFVLADNAPLDKLAQELAAEHGPKVVSFDTTSSPMPYGFTANFIPTILHVRKDGKKEEFVEDPTEIERLKAFALAGGYAD
jgi:thiol-disulfide isomerase/thioredoxin